MAYQAYKRTTTNKQTPQDQRAPGRKDQIKNNAGGYVFRTSPEQRLERFLVLGATGSTYYTSQRRHTSENLDFIVDLIKKDGPMVVNKIAEISDQGRAQKNDHAIYALALCMTHGNAETKKLVELSFKHVVRIGSHLLMFIDSLRSNTGMGRSKKRIIQNWFQNMDPDKLAYQVSKYFNRYGYTMHDVLRLVKPVPASKRHNAVYRWIKDRSISEYSPKILEGVDVANNCETSYQIIKTIDRYGIVREHIPTQWLTDPKVLEAMLPKMPMTALIRNLPNLTRHGVLSPLSNNLKIAIDKITNDESLKRARIHPVNVLKALVTYSSGQSVRGSTHWTPNQDIVDALNSAFYKSFKYIEPTNKRYLLALDVSASMTWTNSDDFLAPYQITAAMSLATKNVEKKCHIIAFDDAISSVNISPRDRLDSVMKKMTNQSFAVTDCSLPMIWAEKNNISVDMFVIYTDNETWAGQIHPFQALKSYRQKMNINAKLAVIATQSTGFTIADPTDAGMMDFVGFDGSTPSALSAFAIEGVIK
jgi:60 kDa SS-A/Ro ribonucleoprotein